MADKPSYPAVDDLQNLITSTGVIDTTGGNFALIDLVAKLDAATDEWEERTGWHPFLGDTADVTRVFDPPGAGVSRQAAILNMRGGGKKLFLGAGLLSLTTLTIGGTGYEEGVQFWLRPSNAGVKQKPFTWIEFLVPVFGEPECIAITGRWGYWTACRNSAWQAILQKAASLCVPEIALNISKGLYERRAGDEAQRFSGTGSSPLSAERAMWDVYFEGQVTDFERGAL